MPPRRRELRQHRRSQVGVPTPRRSSGSFKTDVKSALRTPARGGAAERIEIDMNPCVYILKDSNGAFYIGSTDNLERRIKQHSAGHTQTTKRMSNPTLVLKQDYSTLLEARRIENKLKKLKRKDYIENIIRDGYIKMKI